jgi:hypothetical protein
MKIELRRTIFTSNSTIGELLLNDKFECFTLEDCVRPPGVKIPEETAIPEGSYEVIITLSQRFKRDLPLLLNVPNFEGIRIHTGNTSFDTEGCVLVGTVKQSDVILNSRDAFNALFPKIQTALQTEKVIISIVNVGRQLDPIITSTA